MSKPIAIRDGSAVVKIYPRRIVRSGRAYDTFEIRYVLNGERHRHSRPTEAEARTLAKEKVRLIATGHAAVSSLTPADAAALSRAREILGKTPIEIAASEYVDACHQIAPARLHEAASFWVLHHPATTSQTVPRAVEILLAERAQDGLGKRQLGSLRHRLEHFAASFPTTLSHLASADIEAWMREQQEARSWSAQTRNHYRAAISVLVHFAIRKGWAPASWDPLRTTPKATVERGAVTIYTPAELARLLTAASAHENAAWLVPMIAIGALAGLRPSEIQRLTWSDVHWRANAIHVAKGKVRSRGERLAPMNNALKTWLKPHAGEDTARIVPRNNPYAALRAVHASAEVPVQPDALRHSFVSYRLGITRDLQQVSDETGTDARTLVKHYRRPLTAAEARRWFKVSPDSRKTVGKILSMKAA